MRVSDDITLTVPLFRPSGVPADYLDHIRDALLEAGIMGWTEVTAHGMWNGSPEPVVVIHHYCDHRLMEQTVDLFRNLGEAWMPDQEAVLVTRQPIYTWGL